MTLSRFLQIFSLLTQIALAVLTGVYVLLTWGLLRSSSEQLALARDQQTQSNAQLRLAQAQHRIDVTPYLVATITDTNDVEEKKRTNANSTLSAKQKKDALEQIQKSPNSFACSVVNATSSIAKNLQAIIFNATTQSFHYCRNGQEILSQGAQEEFTFSGELYNQQAIEDTLESSYGTSAQFCRGLLALANESYIAIVFTDMEGRLYLYKRPFFPTDSGELSYRTSVLYSDPKRP